VPHIHLQENPKRHSGVKTADILNPSFRQFPDYPEAADRADPAVPTDLHSAEGTPAAVEPAVDGKTPVGVITVSGTDFFIL